MKSTMRGGSDKKPSTRNRILKVSLALLNEKGPDRVTTAEIARTVGINEGNLYYHFKTKEALLVALFQQLETDAIAFSSAIGANEITEAGAYPAFMRDWFSIVWTHRYMFRDLPGVMANAPSLREPIGVLSGAIRLAVQAGITQMGDVGLIDIPEGEAAALLANVWIVSTYWAVYLSLQEGVEDLRPHHLDWGLNQVTSLFRPYLSPSALQELQALLAQPFATGERS
ncbi:MULTISPECIES: TetR/AcrR family transcriptional regulator [unclassified Rhizobium]|uniref:TetR/AcrR family transcriptional regulator n=1 Tax=unclassified Rhizobium TaxID=2613769 RepID=UPI001782E908|nr:MULTISPECIES: TetR/AcrR family transcriptional regulator [unclassified Rhizobium]MBD8688323.1 TetR/AcrR family transcriptional regulator [Rhizobium sp. CFBP 13644]MBD8692778.1 TetR/AcrR family transcriptional regulator [Rhizobium sp. CFBP 13717]